MTPKERRPITIAIIGFLLGMGLTLLFGEFWLGIAVLAAVALLTFLRNE